MVGFLTLGLTVLAIDAPVARAYHLQNVAAIDVAAAVTSFLHGPCFNLTAEPVTNSVCVSGPLRYHVCFRKMIIALDAPPREFAIRLTLLQGDPLGSREAGTIEVLTSANLQTVERQEGDVSVGQTLPVGSRSVEVGVRLRVLPEPLPSGKIKLRIDSELGTVIQHSGDGISYRTENIIQNCEVKLGEMSRIRVAPRAKKEKWLEVLVTEVTASDSK
jgi:hypothetical protein